MKTISLPWTFFSFVVSTSPIAKLAEGGSSDRGSTNAFVGGEGVISGQIEATSSAIKELLGEIGKLEGLSTRRNSSIVLYQGKLHNLKKNWYLFNTIIKGRR